jgi:hypothetical protein
VPGRETRGYPCLAAPFGGVAEWSNAAALKAVDRVFPVRGFESLPLRSDGHPSRMGPDRRLLLAGLLLLAGGVITLALHAVGAPEALLDFLYDTLLSGLDVPPDPSQTATDIVNYVSLVGGITELLGGGALLVAHRVRQAA